MNQSQTWSYDDRDRMASVAPCGRRARLGPGVAQRSRDNANRVTGLSETATGFVNKTFGYDSRDHVTSLFNDTATSSYTYDADSNRTSAALSGTTTYHYAANGNAKARTYVRTIAGWKPPPSQPSSVIRLRPRGASQGEYPLPSARETPATEPSR